MKAPGPGAEGAEAAAPGRGLMGRALRVAATLGPVGHAPLAPGTAGSLVAAAAWMAASPAPWVGWIAVAALGAVAVAAASAAAEAAGDPDPPQVVIDEAAGMCLALALAPRGLAAAGAAFLAFRAFDVAKPFPVRRLEGLPGGWGIVADDVGAAIYAGAAVRLLWAFLPGRG